MILFSWFRRTVTPPQKKQELERHDQELMQRLQRQLTAERRVLRFDR